MPGWWVEKHAGDTAVEGEGTRQKTRPLVPKLLQKQVEQGRHRYLTCKHIYVHSRSKVRNQVIESESINNKPNALPKAEKVEIKALASPFLLVKY